MTKSAEPVLPERDAPGRYPDFFIVGHAKCGTTALYEMLSRHPQIFMPSVKEPQFFARNPAPSSGAAPIDAFEQTGRRPEALASYLALFDAARPEQRVGEASTFYLWSQAAAERIARAQPAARIIAILREPASFVRSLHLQMLQNRVETERDLRRAIALEEPRRAGREIPPNAHWPRALMYTERVRYVEQLRRYHARFPPEQVLVLIYDDFRRDNEQTVRRLLRFLEVDERAPLEMVSANPTIGVRAPLLDERLRAEPGAEGPLRTLARTTVKAVTTSAMRRAILYPMRRRILYTEPPAPDEVLMLELRERFKGEVAAISEYLDRDLVALWGYDRVG
jgi:hypothetical protein